MTAVFVDVFCPLVALRYVSAFSVEVTKTYLRGYCYTNRKKLLDCAEGICLFLATNVVWPAFYFCGWLGADVESGVVNDLKWWGDFLNTRCCSTFRYIALGKEGNRTTSKMGPI